MNSVLAFDPGLTTGYAYVGSIGTMFDIFEYSEIPENEIISGIFTSSLPIWKSIDIVIEETPIPTRSEANRRLDRIIRSLHYHLQGRKINLIAPGEWKTSRFGSLELSNVSSKHCRDAIRLGWYYLSKMKGAE